MIEHETSNIKIGLKIIGIILIDWFEATLIGIKELETCVEWPTTTWFGWEIIVAWLVCLCEMVTWVFAGTTGILEVETTFF